MVKGDGIVDWKCRYLEEHRVLEIVFSGSTPAFEELEMAVRDSLVQAEDLKTNLFLADCTGLFGSGSLIDVYELAKAFSSLPVPRNVREAVLLPLDDGAAKNLRFYETTTRNRGYRVSVFNDRDAALAWLTEKPSSPD